MSRSIYLEGPMRGIPYYNFPAFDAAADRLRREGWTVFNPAEIDRRQDLFDPHTLPEDWDWNEFPAVLCLKNVILRDIQAVVDADALWMLPGWEISAGARAERAVAEWAGKEIIEERIWR